MAFCSVITCLFPQSLFGTYLASSARVLLACRQDAGKCEVTSVKTEDSLTALGVFWDGDRVLHLAVTFALLLSGVSNSGLVQHVTKL